MEEPKHAYVNWQEYHFPQPRERFVCGGHCMWRMPSKEEIEIDLATTPPPQQMEFVGTASEAEKAGWQLAPRELCYVWKGTVTPLYLCPDCVSELIK